MSDLAIQVESLGKRYRIGQRQPYKTLRDSLTEAVKSPFRRRPSDHDERRTTNDEWIWALKDVSFDVKRGEVVGIIGRNGAGKSTLLKILSRITEPTTGYAEIHGRVGSLLEVGTGFNLELTGRENIYLNGSILGMKKVEIDRRFDEIVAFAEVEQFIDTPVKHYSSGMYMRLAFAVAAHLEPEILIVDEVLAVGDAAFQKKCLGKMGDVAKEGRTVLFVSHNLLAIEGLCQRAMLLKDGKMISEGQPKLVITTYAQTFFSNSSERVWADISEAPGSDEVRLHRVAVRPLNGSVVDPITVSTSCVLEFDYWNRDPSAYLSVSFCLYNQHDILLFDICPPFDPNWRQHPSPTGLLRSVCYIPGNFLNNGVHRVALIVLRDHLPILEEANALVFTVHDEVTQDRDGWYGEWPGALRPLLSWETNLSLETDSICSVVDTNEPSISVLTDHKESGFSRI